MAGTVKKALLLTLSAFLASCASPQRPEINHLNNQVVKLNTKMQQLTQQATVLTQQNMLNNNSTQGAWLLPGANSSVLLKSQVGDLRLSLNHIESEANGTRAILHIRATAENPLPAFKVTVEWGEADPVTGKPLQPGSQSQSFSVAESLLPRSEVTVPLRLSSLQPAQLGYVRVHNILTNPAPSATQ